VPRKKQAREGEPELEEGIVEIAEDVEEIREEIHEAGKDIEEIKEDVEEIREVHKSLFSRLSEKIIHSEFSTKDVAQQIVGAIILSSPFAVTSEVWHLARELDTARLVSIIGITLLFDVLLIYFTGYRKGREKMIFNLVPARLVSMLFISYSVGAVMLYVYGVIGNEVTETGAIINLVLFVGLFTNIGAGTADLIR